MPEISQLPIILTATNQTYLVSVTNGVAQRLAFSGVSQIEGPLGYTGSRGVGYTGSVSNIPGYIGSKGFTGSFGFVGSSGAYAAVGFSGSRGSVGFNGSLGYTGSQGQGYTGSRGEPGSAVDRGFVGSRGTAGVNGTLGFTGSRGDTGNTGETGFVGSMGFFGSRGFAGSAGLNATGYFGSRGFTGSKGETGSGFTGSAGVGFRGSQGEQGPQGPQGIQGTAAASVAVGNGFIAYGNGSGITGNSFLTTDGNGNLSASGDITAFATSDQRLKTNIEIIVDALDKVNRISGITFNWNENAEGKDLTRREAGVLAQQIQAILPEVVTERENGTLAVRYELLVPLLIEAIKELSTEVNKLKNS